MTDYSQLGILDFDHVVFATRDLASTVKLYGQLGFEKLGEREIGPRGLRSVLFSQGNAKIVASHSSVPSDPVAEFIAIHGDGVMDIAFRCENAVTALEATLSRGARVASAPRRIERELGTIEMASIHAMGDVTHTFVQRSGTLFDEGFESASPVRTSGFGLTRFDHMTINVEKGKMRDWALFYEKVFGFKNTRFFDIHTERTGLNSYVMESPDHMIKCPINEPTEETSQIQEFLNINHGPGVQHIAIATNNLISTLRQMRTTGIDFLTVPDTYYEEIPKRVPNIEEDLAQLQALGILADGDSKGYLLQIFTQNLIGPFFYEFIQREGNEGFGEGNFRALFEAIERDQIRRGVLKVQ